MKKNKSVRRNRAAGRYILCVGTMAVLLSVPLPVRAQGVQTAGVKSLIGVMAAVQDTDDTELLENQIQQIEDSTELDAEFSALEEESVMIVEEVERQRVEARRSKIWGAVIIVLVIGIFGMGIVSAVKEKKAENMENTGTELQGKKNLRQRKQEKRKIEDIEIEEITE